MSLHITFNGFRRKYLIWKHLIIHSSVKKQNSLDTEFITSKWYKNANYEHNVESIRQAVFSDLSCVKDKTWTSHNDILTSRKEGDTVVAVAGNGYYRSPLETMPWNELQQWSTEILRNINTNIKLKYFNLKRSNESLYKLHTWKPAWTVHLEPAGKGTSNAVENLHSSRINDTTKLQKSETRILPKIPMECKVQDV